MGPLRELYKTLAYRDVDPSEEDLLLTVQPGCVLRVRKVKPLPERIEDAVEAVPRASWKRYLEDSGYADVDGDGGRYEKWVAPVLDRSATGIEYLLRIRGPDQGEPMMGFVRRAVLAFLKWEADDPSLTEEDFEAENFESEVWFHLREIQEAYPTFLDDHTYALVGDVNASLGICDSTPAFDWSRVDGVARLDLLLRIPDRQG